MKVGLLYARTGPAAIWSASLDAAALLAAAEINVSGGVLGEDLKIAMRDCGETVGSAVEAAETLIAIEGAEVIVGAHQSNLRDPISQSVSGRAGYVYTAQYEGLTCGPSTVAIGSTDPELIQPGFHWLKEAKRAERFFFVGDDYIWPRMACVAARHAVREQGGQWLGETFLASNANDYSGVLAQLARSRAQVVTLALVGQTAVEFNRAFARAGLDEKMLRFGLIIDETVVCGIGAEASVNLFTAAHYFASTRSHGNDGFLERYHDAFGDWAPPVSASSVSYYRGLHYVAGLARVVGSARGRDLARHLDRRAARRTSNAFGRPARAGSVHSVKIAAANGAALQVVAELTSSIP